MAESRSLRVAEAPCIDVPPVSAIFFFGEGELPRELMSTLGKDDMREPAAEGGGLGEAVRDLGLDGLTGIGS